MFFTPNRRTPSALEILLTIRHRYLMAAANSAVYGHDFLLPAPRADLPKVGLDDLTYEELMQLGFSLWDDKTKDKKPEVLLLIPLWAFHHVVGTQVLESIDGKPATMATADSDNRFGYLAYGVRRCPPKPKLPYVRPTTTFFDRYRCASGSHIWGEPVVDAWLPISHIDGSTTSVLHTGSVCICCGHIERTDYKMARRSVGDTQ